MIAGGKMGWLESRAAEYCTLWAFETNFDSISTGFADPRTMLLHMVLRDVTLLLVKDPGQYGVMISIVIIRDPGKWSLSVTEE